MENATKALLIAAGVMIAIMILSLLVIGYNQISSYYNAKHEETVGQQLEEFNRVYENYHRNNIRGSDLISLMNRIIDYNERQSYQSGTNYKRIEVKIKIGGTEIVNQFKYNSSDSSILQLQSGYITNTGSGTDSRTLDRNLIAITNTETNLITEANNAGISGLTDAKLQKLSSNIHYIMISEGSSESEIRDKEKRTKLLKSILGTDISSDTNKMNTIKKITCQYYQYTQFKRAYFNCTEVRYDEDTGRVCEMNFELQVKDGKVEFN